MLSRVALELVKFRDDAVRNLGDLHEDVARHALEIITTAKQEHDAENGKWLENAGNELEKRLKKIRDDGLKQIYTRADQLEKRVMAERQKAVELEEVRPVLLELIRDTVQSIRLPFSGMVFRGQYDPRTVYAQSEVVYYKGGSYVSLTDNNRELPTGETWQQMAAPGQRGMPGQDGKDGAGVLSDANPLPLGPTADPGTANEVSRADHVHPEPVTLPTADEKAALAGTSDTPSESNPYVTAQDPGMTNAREWTAATVGQAEAEAGTATTRRAWTAQRVAQAIAAQAVSATGANYRFVRATGANAAANGTILTDAQTAASAGETIFVLPGEYEITSPLGKNGVNWWFAPGSVVSAATRVFSVESGSTISVVGAGRFTGAGTALHDSVVYVAVGGKIAFFQADEIFHDPATQTGFAAALEALGDFSGRIRNIESTAYDAVLADGGRGEVFVEADTIKGHDNGVDFVNGAGEATLYLKARRIEGGDRGPGHAVIIANEVSGYIQAYEFVPHGSGAGVASMNDSEIAFGPFYVSGNLQGRVLVQGDGATGLILDNAEIKTSSANSIESIADINTDEHTGVTVKGTLKIDKPIDPNATATGGIVMLDGEIIVPEQPTPPKIPYDMLVGFAGQPEDEQIDRIPIQRAITYENGSTPQVVFSEPPDSLVEFIIKAGSAASPTTLGKMEISSAGNAEWTQDAGITADVNFSPGHVLQIEAPDPADPELADIFVTVPFKLTGGTL